MASGLSGTGSVALNLDSQLHSGLEVYLDTKSRLLPTRRSRVSPIWMLFSRTRMGPV